MSAQLRLSGTWADINESAALRKNLALLARIYSVSTQEELTEDIRYMAGAVLEFAKSYENLIAPLGVLAIHDGENMRKCCFGTWLKGNKLKGESLSDAILLQQQVNYTVADPNTCLSWEEVFMQNRAISTLTGLIDKPPAAAMIHEMQKTTVHFRKYRANRGDIVTSALVTAWPESRCSRYLSCQNHENERYFGEVDRLFSCTWHRKDHQLALVKVFDKVRYAKNQGEIYGRVQTLKSRKSYLVCICLANIECTVGITYIRFTKQEYMLNRNFG
ncbi:hypothetical protein V1508DRAFT_454209 [Lipomyces doorenjongii]|uniref:uncharacterized protein n=1 Tax=Lipomyces doorenjongii TaxID=383834 RepID=UPI0034CFF897